MFDICYGRKLISLRHVFPVLVLSLITASIAIGQNATQVTVDVRHGYSVNGHTQVRSNVFGVTAYEGATLPVTATGQAIIRQAGLHSIGFPGVIWCAPADKPADGAPGIARWYASPEAKHEITDLPLGGDRYEYGKILPACRSIGVEPVVYLLGGPAWIEGPENIPNDDKLYAALVVGYVGLLRQFDPDLHIFHLDNEPNVHWFKVDKYGADYSKLFNVVSSALHAKYPDVVLGGPVLNWPPSWPPQQPPLPNWYTWDQWTQPFLNGSLRQTDFFDFHHYDMTDEDDRSQFLQAATEEVTLISNEMQSRHNQKPVMITEAGLALSESDWRDPASHWRRRTFPWAHFLLSMLDRPDEVSGVQMHDMHAIATTVGWFKFLGDNGDGSYYTSPSPIIDRTVLSKQPPTYWLYWLMRHTRGNRLAVVQSSGSGITAFATRHDNPGIHEAAVLLLNENDTAQSVIVHIKGANSSKLSWERLYLDDARDSVVHELGAGALPKMPAHSLAVVLVPMAANAPLTTTAVRTQIFGSTLLQEFPQPGAENFHAPEATVTIPVTISKAALVGAQTAIVRLGIQGSVPKDVMTLIADGHEYKLAAGTYYQEVLLSKLPRTGNYKLAVRLDRRDGGHRVRVSFVAMVIEARLSERKISPITAKGSRS